MFRNLFDVRQYLSNKDIKRVMSNTPRLKTGLVSSNTNKLV